MREPWQSLARTHRATAHRLRREHHIADGEPLILKLDLYLSKEQREADEAYFAEVYRWRPTRSTP